MTISFFIIIIFCVLKLSLPFTRRCKSVRKKEKVNQLGIFILTVGSVDVDIHVQRYTVPGGRSSSSLCYFRNFLLINNIIISGSLRSEAVTACQTFCEVCSSSPAFEQRSGADGRHQFPHLFSRSRLRISCPYTWNEEVEQLFSSHDFGLWGSVVRMMMSCQMWQANSGPAGMRAPSWQNNSVACHP